MIKLLVCYLIRTVVIFIVERRNGDIEMKKIKIPCELALVTAVITNSLGVVLMTKSNCGITPIASISYVLSEAFPALSLGAWNY